MKKLHLIILNLCLGLVAIGQPPDYAYEGGDGGGYTLDTLLLDGVYLYEGDNGSGYTSMVDTTVDLYLYEGGNGQGYTALKQFGGEILFYRGGIGEGYTQAKDTNSIAYLFEGGLAGGYDEENVLYSGTTFYEGDEGDGYDQIVWCHPFIWTGTIGTGWSVEGNWNFNTVPDISRPVIIPAGVPNYPNVNAGILAIGKNPNSGEFECKSILVENGGFLFTRINNFVENYGEIVIDGTMRVKNSAVNALQNLENGLIRITPTGTLLFQE